MDTKYFKLIGTGLNTLSYISPKLLGKVGFELFCRPFCPPLKDKQQSFLTAAKDFTYVFEDQQIQTYKWGSGSKKILLIHGWASSTYRWRTLIELLIQRDYTVFAIDAPAHGNSGGKILNVLKYSACLKQYIDKMGAFDGAISHSLGGFTLLHSFYKDKDLPISRVVTMAAPGEVIDFLSHYQSLLGLHDRTMSILSKEFTKEVGNEPSYFSSRRFATAINRPTLIIHDIDDKDTPYHYSVELSNIIPNAELYTTRELGHHLNSDQVNREIIRFMDIRQ